MRLNLGEIPCGYFRNVIVPHDEVIYSVTCFHFGLVRYRKLSRKRSSDEALVCHLDFVIRSGERSDCA